MSTDKPVDLDALEAALAKILPVASRDVPLEFVRSDDGHVLVVNGHGAGAAAHAILEAAPALLRVARAAVAWRDSFCVATPIVGGIDTDDELRRALKEAGL